LSLKWQVHATLIVVSNKAGELSVGTYLGLELLCQQNWNWFLGKGHRTHLQASNHADPLVALLNLELSSSAGRHKNVLAAQRVRGGSLG
jgi:hypothetical protein